MAASTINNYLSSGDSLSRLQAHAGRLLRLQRQLAELLPDYLSSACKVANLKGDELVIHVDSAGLAVKLRQAVPSLLADFAHAGVLLRDIKVRCRCANIARRRRPRSSATSAMRHAAGSANSPPAFRPTPPLQRRSNAW